MSLAHLLHRASGIHDHPTRKLGRRAPSRKPALRLADALTGTLPERPAAVDHLGKLEFGLYENDQFGDCGPTSAANLVRLVTAGLLGQEIKPSQDDVFDLYRRSGNPNFDPKTDADDNGVDMQTMLEALVSGGIGDGKGGTIKPLAFAKVDVSNDDELEAAVSIFGGTLWGVNLLDAQKSQSDPGGTWDYQHSAEWGGHAIVNGAYEQSLIEDVITWAERIKTTQSFRLNQLEEAWVVIFQWHLDHPAFQEGVDLAALASAYQVLTGRPLPLPDPPPVPVPAPPVAANTVEVGPFDDKTAARLQKDVAKYGYDSLSDGLTHLIRFGHWHQ